MKKILSRGEKNILEKTFLEKKLPPFENPTECAPADSDNQYITGLPSYHAIYNCGWTGTLI